MTKTRDKLRTEAGSTSGREKVFRRVEGVITRRIAGETLLVPVRHRIADMERIFTLNSIGADIWEQLDGERGPGAIVDRLLETYDVDRERAREDLAKLLDQLSEAGLVEELG